jgi:hypothetical protein
VTGSFAKMFPGATKAEWKEKTGQYADWTKTSAYSIQSAEGATQYHLVVSRDGLGRKILFFNPDGHLLANH